MGSRPIPTGYGLFEGTLDQSRQGPQQTALVRELLDNRDVLLGFIFALTRDYNVSEEIFQEVAVAVIEEAGRGTAVAHFMPWAREIARRRIADHYRKCARRATVEQVSGTMAEAVGQAFAENDRSAEDNGLRLQYLLECLKRLSGRSRDVIEGYYYDRKCLRDIASTLGWKENSVKVALARARKVLADCVHGKLHRQ